MDDFAKLLTAIAALIAAMAWPSALLAIIFVFKTELRSALSKIPYMLDRVTKASLAGVALELGRVANAEVESGASKSGEITPRQIEAAARIKIETQDLSAQALLNELDRLCLEYDSVRLTLPSGEARTRAMTRILVQMRSLGPSLINFLDVYKSSGSPGSRLAAIAMMQMVPKTADLDWLRKRFSTEQPFLFYHAALALQNVANSCETVQEKRDLQKVSLEALATIKNFSGIPDKETIKVLEALNNSLERATSIQY